jgi:hypothetical protein
MTERKPMRDLIFALNTAGKSDEVLAHEAWEVIQAWRRAKALGETFKPVIDPPNHEDDPGLMCYTVLENGTVKIALAVGYPVAVN